MDYNTLLDIAAELAYRLAMSGAETFRIEDSVYRIMHTYGIKAEVFAIPNCLHISIETPDGQLITRMRRIGFHGNDLDAVEKYSNLSREICNHKPSPRVAFQWLKDTSAQLAQYPVPIYLVGNFLGGCGFCTLFGGSLTDSLCSGLCGLVVGLVVLFMDHLRANPFFKTISASFLMALLAYFLNFTSFVQNVDAIIIGALMILVPGLLFTNAMRDIIYGDTNSGVNRIVQVFLIAAAIALGTGAAWTLVASIRDTAIHNTIYNSPLIIEAVACFIGCFGFMILFNIHGYGGILCVLGGVLTWMTYRLVCEFGGDKLAAYFWATVVATLYSEVMARIRRCPATCYLVVAAFPLIPGAGVYYTMNHAVRGDLASFANQGVHTVAIAGIMAVGILLSSTLVRMISDRIQKKTL